jgi:excisionase family DNA binding protein
MNEKAYLSIDDVANQFGVNSTTIYRLAQTGKIPGFKIGGQWRFEREMLRSWVADQTTISWIQVEDN